MMKSKLQPILRSALLLLMALLPTILSAHDIEVNGIFYNINGTNATVTFKGQNVNSYSNEYTGNVVIPSTVTYNGITYLVTSIGNEAFQVCQDLVSVTIPNSVTTIGDNAFSYNRGLTSVTIPNSVTTIGESAFFDCSGLTSVTIPNSVTTISAGVFCGCSGLTRVTIPNSVTSIGDLAFGGCSSLTSVTIPNSVTSIGYAAFKTCSGLINITIPNSVASIGDDAFSGCSGLTSVVLSNSVTNIRRYAFYGCSSLTSVTIPNSVLSIGESAFYGCSSLTSVTIPNSVLSIGESAFSGCSSLTSVTIPNSVTSIGYSAFSGCTRLTDLIWNARNCSSYGNMSTSNIERVTIGNEVETLPDNFMSNSKITSVTIPNSVSIIGKRAFYRCSSLEKLDFNAISCADFNYSGSDHPFYDSNITKINIGDNVKRIPAYFANSMTKLPSITIPNSVVTIGTKAFYCCPSLKSVTIGNSVTNIGEYAFQGCTSLKTLYFYADSCADFARYFIDGPERIPFYNLNITTINIGNNVQRIPDYFAYGLKELTNISIGNSVTNIGDLAFYECSGLTSVEIPNSVKGIGHEAFYNCSGLASINLPNGISYISSGVFHGCGNLMSITIPNTVTEIGYGAFSCSGLTKIIIPNSVEKIGGIGLWHEAQGAFEYCSNLKEVSIGENVNTIESYVFMGCDNLEKLTWKARNCTTMGDMPKSNISSLSIGSNVKTLPSEFVAGSKIKTAGIPNSVTRIDDHAFYDCKSLTTLSIGNSVNSIGQSAFLGCKNLTKVYCRANMPPMYEPNDNRYALFEDITSQNSILYVPDLTYSFYKQSEPWNKFLDIKTESFSSDDGFVDFDSMIYPTSVRINATRFDHELIENDYFTFMDEKYNPLVVTGLEPLNLYSTTYTIIGDITYRVPLKFYTSELRMVPEGGKMLNATTAQLMAETNMADEETMCGFDWRRSDGPEDYLGTRSYCPVYDGKMAGTLKNLSKDTWYKFRPFYKSSAGNVYYGDWVTFYSGDWGVEFDPVVYTYQSPAVTQTDATLQGVALRGSSEITEQGFEYWKSGTSNVKKVTASGERMSATVNGLDPETSYKFRAFVTSDGKTLRGSDVEFVTRSGEHHVDNVLDVNADGIVNIADMNVVINVILRGNNDRTCDVNGDGLVNISDLNAIISAILAN